MEGEGVRGRERDGGREGEKRGCWESMSITVDR